MLFFILLVLLFGAGEWLLQLAVTIGEGAYNVTGETRDEKLYRERYGADLPGEGLDRD